MRHAQIVRGTSTASRKATSNSYFQRYFRTYFQAPIVLSGSKNKDFGLLREAQRARRPNPCEAGATPFVDAQCVTDLLRSLPPHTKKPAFHMFQWIRKKSRLLSDTFFAKKADRILVEGDLAPVPSMEAQA